jgi:hypothetical protein
VLEADEEVTIFFRAGVFPNHGISVGLQEEAVKISEPIDSLSSSLRCADDLCFGCKAYNSHIFRARMRGSLTGFFIHADPGNPHWWSP